MNKKYRVEVCLSGLFRNWDLCRANFRYWETLHGDISFEYFISTWDETQYLTYDEKTQEVKREVKPVTPNHFVNDFNENQLKSYKLNTEDPKSFRSIQESGVNIVWNNKKYAFLFMDVNLLKVEYELENNFIYDAVISTRPDVLIHHTSIDLLKELFLNDNVFKEDTLEIFLDKQMQSCNDKSLAWGYTASDVFSFSRSSTMDIYSGIYRYAYMSEEYNMVRSAGSVNPFYMRYAGLWEAHIRRSNRKKIYLPMAARLGLRTHKEKLNSGEWVYHNWHNIDKITWEMPIKNKYENYHG
jgi:hypothetical protein